MPRLPSQLTYNDLNGDEAVEILTDWFRQLLKSSPLLQPHLTLPMARLSLDINVGIDMYVGGTVPVASPPEHVDIDGNVTLDNNVRSLTHATGRDSVPEHREEKLAAVVNAAPLPGGSPPDQIREQHGLPVPRPAYGPRETGSHLFLSDIVESTEAALRGAPEKAHSETGGRSGIVAEGYQFSKEAPPAVVLEQTIELENGAIEIDMAGRGIHHAGMLIKDDTHRKSVKEFGDKRGERYSSVNGVYDAGPAGLMNNRGGGLGSDGRARINFGNPK